MGLLYQKSIFLNLYVYHYGRKGERILVRQPLSFQMWMKYFTNIYEIRRENLE